MKQYIFILSLSLLNLCALGQNQGNIWYLNDFSGIDFNTDSPVVIQNPAAYFGANYSIRGGSSIISDSAGKCLFYTNGEKLWNRNYEVMPNGDSLMGNNYSTQSSIIIPQPGSSRYFYVFTADNYYRDTHYQGIDNGFRYSVVDICLNQGLGDVMPGKKNIALIDDSVTEKVAALRHANGIDYWIITHRLYTNEFYAFRLTAQGISDTVISSIGSIHLNGAGQLKASPGGNRLALSATQEFNNYGLPFELFDFDNTTGMVSNFKPLSPAFGFGVYGVEFSPDGTKLYATESREPSNSRTGLYQYDLNAGGGNTASINASIFEVFRVLDNAATNRGLQLGPDGKIYMIRSDFSYLMAIGSPNNLGSACNIIYYAAHLNGINSPTLPTFVAGYSYSNGVYHFLNPVAITTADSVLCANETTQICAPNGYLSYSWNVGGHAECISTPAAGSYFVSVININHCPEESNHIGVISIPPLPVSISAQSDTLHTNSLGISFQWHLNNDTISAANDSIYITSQAGSYTVNVVDAYGCTSISDPFLLTGFGRDAEEIFSVFPNPATDRLIIKGEVPEPSEINIYNVNGEIMFRAIPADQKSIDIGKLDQGVYLVELKTRQGTARKRWTKL